MIEGIFYTEEVDEFFCQIEEGRTYMISKAEISVSNKKFTAVKHDYRLIFKNHSIFEEARMTSRASTSSSMTSKGKINGLMVNLARIQDVMSGNCSFTVDVCGICTTEARRESITANHSEFKQGFKGRLQLTIVESLTTASPAKAQELQVNMWGEELTRLEIKQGDVLLI